MSREDKYKSGDKGEKRERSSSWSSRRDLALDLASEVTDLYMWITTRRGNQDQNCCLYTYMMDRDRKVDYTKGERTPFFKKESDKIKIQIRIPAIMCFKHTMNMENLDPVKEEFQSYMNKYYRPQVGIHAFLSHPIHSEKGQLRFVRTNESDDLEYRVEKKNTRICSIYPCFRSVAPPTTPSTDPNKKPQNFQIVFGLCFLPKQELSRQRTWGRFQPVDKDNYYSFDLTHRVFEPRMEGNEFANYAKPDFFPVIGPGDAQGEQWSIAFYVCQGARAVLIDHRQLKVKKGGTTDHQEDKKPGDEYEHCRSLCQQGSVIVIRGSCKFAMMLRRDMTREEISEEKKKKSQELTEKERNKDKGYWKRLVNHEYKDFMQSDYIRPNTSTDLDLKERDVDATRVKVGEDQYQDLSQLKDKVIFLGVTESPFNSACWEINIDQDDESNVDHWVQLVPSDGAMIVDIAPWTLGFQLIHSRQRYERLYESVVHKFDPSDYDPNMEFELPGDQYLVKRMIGIRNDDRKNAGIRDGWYNTFQVVVPPRSRGEERRWKEGYRLERDDQDIRRYIPLHPESQTNLQMRNIEIHQKAPLKFAHYPLYPPYQPNKENENKLYYLWGKEKVVSVRDNDGQFGNYFKIVSNPGSTGATIDPNTRFKLVVKEINDYDFQFGRGRNPGFGIKYRLGIDYQKHWRPDMMDENFPYNKMTSFCLMQTEMEKAKRKEESEESGQEHKKKKKDSGGSGSGHKSSHSSSEKSGEKQKSGESKKTKSKSEDYKSKKTSSSDYKEQKKEESEKKGSKGSGSGSGHKSSHTSGHKSGEKHRSSSESEKKKKSGK